MEAWTFFQWIGSVCLGAVGYFMVKRVSEPVIEFNKLVRKLCGQVIFNENILANPNHCGSEKLDKAAKTCEFLPRN